MSFRRAATRDELWIGEMKGVIVDGVPVLLVSLDDGVRAYEDRCPHKGVALSEGCVDPTGPKAVRASMGSLFRVPLSGFDEPQGKRIALMPSDGIPLPELHLDGDVVLVLGAEREGLPPEILERCAERASIPQPGGGESLNVAMAGAIALYELARRNQT